MIQNTLYFLYPHSVFVRSFQLIDVVGAVSHTLQGGRDGAPTCAVLWEVFQQALQTA